MAADLLELYRWAVQDPETHAAVLTQMYLRLRDGCRPSVLREDFSGTSAESVAWVAAEAGRTAVAIDQDRATMAWARQRAARLLGDEADRVRFVEADVLTVEPPRVSAADVISVLNFSILYFHQREQLAQYLQHAQRCLAPGGILVTNVFGGPGALRTRIDRRRVEPVSKSANEPAPPPFEYRWEQRGYNAVSGRIDCRIHFTVDSAQDHTACADIEDAFRYDWRLWTIPELVELMHEANFADVQVWRHTYDPSKGADGVMFGPVDRIENEDTWLAYVIGLR
jgi:SAM-dependent methyltransferase